MKPKTAFITIHHDYTTIEGGLIFSKQDCAIFCEDNSVSRIEILNNHIISTRPKWWQIRKWWEIIQLIRSHTIPPA